MNIALNREATVDKSREATRKTNGQFEALTLDTAFSEAVRELAETSVAQTREAYERSKNAFEAAVDTMARSFDALGQGAAALNRKIIEIAHQNVSSGFDLAKSLATAKTLAEMVEFCRRKKIPWTRRRLRALKNRWMFTAIFSRPGRPSKFMGAAIQRYGLVQVRDTSRRFRGLSLSYPSLFFFFPASSSSSSSSFSPFLRPAGFFCTSRPVLTGLASSSSSSSSV